jgi:hypothetical protein
MRATHVVVDTTNGDTFWKTDEGVPFTYKTAADFASLRNEADVDEPCQVFRLERVLMPIKDDFPIPWWAGG